MRVDACIRCTLELGALNHNDDNDDDNDDDDDDGVVKNNLS